MLGGQSKHDMGDFVEHGEALPLLGVIAVDDDDVFSFEPSGLTGLVVSEIEGDLDLRVGRDSQTLDVDGHRVVTSVPEELASTENRRELVHSLVVFTEQAVQAINVSAPIVLGFRALSPEAHLVSRLKQVQRPVLIFDEHVDEGAVDGPCRPVGARGAPCEG